ncbi:MAG: hypothetical protein ACPKOP_06060 [Sphaerochaetaceae bacterium]
MSEEKKDTEKNIDATTVEVEEVKEDTGGIRSLPYYDIHSIIALVLGILALLSPFMVFGLGGILGLILGVISLYQVRQSRKQFDNDMNHVAKILAVIGLVVSVVAIGFAIVAMTSFAWHIADFGSITRTYHFGPRMTYMHRVW